MKELTKAELEVMKHLWRLRKAFLKDIVEAYPEPRPASTTVATVIRVLIKKGVVGFKTYSKINEYFPLISRQAYFQQYLRNLIGHFFNGSHAGFASFFTEMEEMSVDELEELKGLIENRIEEKKEDHD